MDWASESMYRVYYDNIITVAPWSKSFIAQCGPPHKTTSSLLLVLCFNAHLCSKMKMTREAESYSISILG